jgi:TetR/AcrR family transcriptional repressor of lmrAB and yxaGH operons
MGASDARDRMVEAGVELFGQRGYANVSLLEVIERANAPRGSIYYHFPGGKEELGIEVSARLRHSVQRQVVMLAARADSAEAFLRAFVDLNRKQLAATDFGQGCTMAGILANIGADASEPLRMSVGDTISGWIEAITDGLVSRGVESERAKMVAGNVVAAIEGATIVSRATRSMAPFAQIKVMLAALLSADSES